MPSRAPAPQRRLFRALTTLALATLAQAAAVSSAQAQWQVNPKLGCFRTKQEAINAYFAYENPDSLSLPPAIFYRDRCTLRPDENSIDCSGHRTNLGPSDPYFFTWIAPIGSCGVPLDKGKGPSCPSTPNPISIGTGTKHFHEADYSAKSGALAFSRLYRSDSIALPGSLGKNWQHSFDKSILYSVNGTAGTATAYRPGGRVWRFPMSAGVGIPDADLTDRVTEILGSGGVRVGWTYTDSVAESSETYDAEGRLDGIRFKDGTSQVLAYTDGTNGAVSGRGGYALDNVGIATTTVLPVNLLLRVGDTYGRQLSFGYDTSSRLVALIDAAGVTTRYVYNEASGNCSGGCSKLTSVVYPDLSKRTYWYDEINYSGAGNTANIITGIVDENGVRIATYTYDAHGKAIDEFNPAAGPGVGHYQLAFDAGGLQTTLTDPSGTSRAYGFQSVQGVLKPTSRSQPAGSGCSASMVAQSYDANGNRSSEDDFNGSRSCYVNELGRNLEAARVEGLANTQACDAVTPANAVLPNGSRKISTVWHPDRRMQVQVAEPNKLTTSIYNGQPDPLSGGAVASCAPATALLPDGKPIAVLCKQVEQATTDTDGRLGFGAALQPGVPNRVQTWTYNQYGQVLTAKGPRTDVSDTTTYVYYTDNTPDHTLGDLQSMTNAAGKTTTYGKYNKAGQLLESTDANGVLTTNIYDVRQRLLSTSLAGELTGFSYDAVGHLKTTTLPNGAVITNTYDAAHRLVQVRDAAGNTTIYTLDNAGNRIGEQVKDASGTLVKNITRSYDALNRLQSVTGAAR
jgi:YD repeat-containing protein